MEYLTMVQEVVNNYKTAREKAIALNAINTFIETEKARGVGIKVGSSQDIHRVLTPYFIGLEVEYFYVICLTASNKILSINKVNEGTVNSTIVDIKLIMRTLINTKRCTAAIVAHNHPSGNIQPSEADIRLTKKLKELAQFMDVKLLDSYIYGDMHNYYSMTDEGVI